MSKLVPIIYMVGVLLLILPSFIKTNQNLKTFLTNLSIWFSLILVLFSLYYLFKLVKNVFKLWLDLIKLGSTNNKTPTI